jgi:beta-xylosidase
MFLSNQSVPGYEAKLPPMTRSYDDPIPCRDPFILLAGDVYHLYKRIVTDGENAYIACQRSTDLVHWTEPEAVFTPPADFHGVKDMFWAPECHYYKGKYYIFTSVYSSRYNHRCISVYRADSPMGPFEDIADGCVTVPEWDTIDGTLYVDEQGDPWLVFVHEWTCMPDRNGSMMAARLSEDLSHLVSEPVTLFYAKDPAWAAEGVTDGPYLYRMENGHLLMIWSNFTEGHEYVVAMAHSETGSVLGPWTHDEKLLYQRSEAGGLPYEGGHGMLFYTREGQLTLSLHTPNNARIAKEHLCLLPVREEGNTLVIERR